MARGESPPQARVDPIHIACSNSACDQALRTPTRSREISGRTPLIVAAQVLDSNDDQPPPRAWQALAACLVRAQASHQELRRRARDHPSTTRAVNQASRQADALGLAIEVDPRRAPRNQNQNYSTPLRQVQTTHDLSADQVKVLATKLARLAHGCVDRPTTILLPAAQVDQDGPPHARAQIDRPLISILRRKVPEIFQAQWWPAPWCARRQHCCPSLLARLARPAK